MQGTCLFKSNRKEKNENKLNTIRYEIDSHRQLQQRSSNIMEYFNVLVVLLLAFLTMECQAENQKFTIEPENQSAKIGSRVLLPCRVVGKLGVLQWTKDDFGLGTHRNLTAFDRYTMVGNEDDGDYTLQIESLQLEDDAKYQCQVSPGPEGT